MSAFRTNELGESIDPTPSTRYVAKCSCGWTSARRINPNDVVALAENHDERAHPYRRDFRQTDPIEVTR